MKKGIPSYPVHDSIIVPETSSEDAMCCLKECFRDRLGGEVIVIEGGEKKFDGSIEELTQNPEIKAKYLAV